MNQIELSELVKGTSVCEIAAKTVRNMSLNDNEKTVAEYLDEWARKIGETGHDEGHEIAAYVTRTIREEVYDAPDELLDAMFERGSVGEFDDYEAIIDPIKNTLVAYDAAYEGNVPKSYLDFTSLKPTWKHAQVESQLSYADLRRSGWKTVALLTEYAEKALKNKMFYDIFSVVNAAIAQGAENCIVEAGSVPSQATMDAVALYLNDRNGGSVVGLSKYIQAISKLQGYNSEEMLNELHRTGRLGVYDGVSLYPISGAKKQGNGELLVPDKALWGIAGKIGSLDMKGEVRTYETENNNKETIDLKITGFAYGYSFNKDSLENICKVVISG